MIHTDGKPTIVSGHFESTADRIAREVGPTLREAAQAEADASNVPPHLRGAISPERWEQICREDQEAEESE